MTTFVLIRHGAHDRLGRYLDGRRPGVHLSDIGRHQASAIAARLAEDAIDALFVSPRERARETAEPIAARTGCEAIVDPALDEIDFGQWSGMTFEALEADERWHAWNRSRSSTKTPAGDTMSACQTRMLEFIEARHRDAPGATTAIVGHADPIKAVVAAVLGLSLDELARFEIAPASLSCIKIEPWAWRLTSLNEQVRM